MTTAAGSEDFQVWVEGPSEQTFDLPLSATPTAVVPDPGLGGTVWRSELTLANRGTEPAVVTLALHPRDDGTPATTEVEVPALAALHLDDVVGSTLAASGSGWLGATSTSGGLLLSSRTFNDDPDGTLVGELDVIVPPQSLVQLDRVLTASFSYTGRAWATLSSDDPAAAFSAYASVVDEGTGDPVFIPAVRAATGR